MRKRLALSALFLAGLMGLAQENQRLEVGGAFVFANDPTAGTWLAPAKGARFIRPLRAGKKATIVTMGTSLTGGGGRWPDVMMKDRLSALLEPLGGQLRLLTCWYDGSKLAASRPFVAGELRTPDTRWTSDVRATPVAGEPDALDLAITFRMTEGMAGSAGVAAAFDFADWSTNNYVMIPASIYNGNRNRIEYRGYCTGFNPEDFYHKDLPGIYVRTDRDEMFVFDHVEARVLKRDKEGVTLKIVNPTKFDARVAIFTEDRPRARPPLGITGFLRWPKVAILAGSSLSKMPMM
jgi:hypothetical protein